MELTQIYLMRDDHTKMCKIGRSYDSIQRERTLLSQAPLINLLCYWKAPAVAEKQLHDAMSEHRRRGEWFELDDWWIGEVLRLMGRYRRTDVHDDMVALSQQLHVDDFHECAVRAYFARESEARQAIRYSRYDFPDYIRAGMSAELLRLMDDHLAKSTV